jgi:GT2 family glycosyltransferase
VSNRTVPGRVSVVIVNYKGCDDTITCLESLGALDWPDVEVIVVDNGSGDGSAEVLSARFPEARIVALDTNLGFAGGCNQGAHVATGEYVAFLNNDARPDPAWLRAAVNALTADGSIGCVASKILDWEGEGIDYVGSYLAFYGHGFKRWDGAPDSPAFDEERDTLFASGAAMVLPREVFLSAGSFDDRYFMFFEDVDLGWRLWLLGYRVRYVASSVVYHKHHRSMQGLGDWKEHYLLERNALFTIFKNYDDEHLRAALPAALLLDARRATAMGDLDAHTFDLAGGTADDDAETTTTVPKLALARLYAIDAFVEALPELAESRKALQFRRRRGDAEILPLFREPFEPVCVVPAYLEGYRSVVDALGLEAVFSGRNKILVLTPDVLGVKMAGPAIRAWQIAKALGKEQEVVLALDRRVPGPQPS